MSQHFLENIKIENFKCFENLEINDFKRVNVFGGKNNVGKTALLEAIELLTKSGNPNSLAHNAYLFLKRRQPNSECVEFDAFGSSIDGRFLIKSSRKKVGMSLSLDGQQLTFQVDEQTAIIDNLWLCGRKGYKEDTSSKNNNFINSCTLDEVIISILYGHVVEAGQEGFLNKSLTEFDSDIVSFKVIPTEKGIKPKIKTSKLESNKLVSLSVFGDGLNRYISIFCAIWASQNGFLFIDEIENGIHYSNYKELWELIFMASEQANCQVFVTTHSKECITVFNEVQQERNDDAGRYFELFKSPKKQRIMAAIRDAEQLQYALENDKEIRGE